MLDYHSQTTHSYRSVRTKSHSIDWDHAPQKFKIYPDTFTRIPLDKTNPGHLFFYLIGGITAQKRYSDVTYALRTNPSAGALYPTETYVQIRGVDGFENGIYHLSPYETSLVLLYPLVEDEGIESLLHVTKINGFIFLFSAIYYRSSWKYKDRAFRYCLHDTGHMLGTLEASCAFSQKTYRILYQFEKKELNALFGFTKEEFFLSAAIVGKEGTSITFVNSSMHFPFVNGTGSFERNEHVEKAYEETCELLVQEQTHMPCIHLDHEGFSHAILKRRSIRDFMQKPITKEQFLETMAFVTQPIPSDCDVGIKIYAVINRIEGMWQGLWYD